MITQSWIRSQSAANFIIRRVLRIYPAYLMALAFSVCAGVVGSGPEATQYLKNLYYENDRGLQAVLFLDYGWLDQPQTFATNPHRAVNGSLWTLQPELQCYLLTLTLGVFGMIGRRRVAVLMMMAITLIYAVNSLHLWSTGDKLSRFLMFFMIGSTISNGLFGAIRLKPSGLLISCLLIFAALQSQTIFVLVYPPVYAYLLFGIVYSRFTPAAVSLATTDLSYGIYLYAFPIQQLLVQSLHLTEPIILFSLSLPATAACGFASWKLIEQPLIAKAGRLTRRVVPPVQLVS